MAAQAESAASSNTLHILLVPFQSEGHVTGALRLGQYLAGVSLQTAFHLVVTFAYPTRSYHLALNRGALPSSTFDGRLRLRPVEDGLPRDEKQNLSLDVMGASLPIYQQNVKLFLEELQRTSGSDDQLPPVCCLISDTFTPWAQDIADSAHLPRVEFWTSTAACYSMGFQLSTFISQGVLPIPKSSWVDSETKWTVNAPLIEGVPGLPPFPATDLPQEFVIPEEVTDLRLGFMMSAFGRTRDAHTIWVNSVYGLENPVFDALQAIDLPIHPVGPLPAKPQDSITSTGNQEIADKPKCLSWLDNQAPCSVIYVAFGSVAALEKAEIRALALGLEASERPFLWVIRTDELQAGSALAEVLPDGFHQRTIDRGAGLIVSWAPQTHVLAHPAIAAFFSHCGWNSTLESMWEGVPLLACPRKAEQRSNARWIVEKWKVGVALDREVDGSFTQEAVEKGLGQLLSKDGASAFKQRALQTKDMIRASVHAGGHSYKTIVMFLEGLHARNHP